MFGQRRIPRHMLLTESRTGTSIWWRLGVMLLVASLAFGAGLTLADAGLAGC